MPFLSQQFVLFAGAQLIASSRLSHDDRPSLAHQHFSFIVRLSAFDVKPQSTVACENNKQQRSFTNHGFVTCDITGKMLSCTVKRCGLAIFGT